MTETAINVNVYFRFPAITKPERWNTMSKDQKSSFISKKKTLMRKSEKTSTLYYFIEWDNERIRLSTGEKLAPAYWNEKKQKADIPKVKPDMKQPEKDLTARVKIERNSINIRIESKITEIKSLLREFQGKNHRTPTKDELTDLIAGERTVTTSFFEYFKNHLVGLRHNNKNQYMQIYNTLEAWKPKLSFLDLNNTFFKHYVALLEEKGYSRNNIKKHISKLRAVMNAAYKDDLIEGDKYKKIDFTYSGEVINNIVLSESEITDLYELDLSDKRYLERARDFFILGITTGLRYSDFSRLTMVHLETKEYKGKEYQMFKIKTLKTGKYVETPLHWMVRELIEKYNGLPPKISAQKLNDYIKLVGAEVESLKVKHIFSRSEGGEKTEKVFNKFDLITTHTCRRSWATNKYLAKWSLKEIMKVTGHSKIATLENYIKTDQLDTSIRLFEDYEKPKKAKRRLKIV